MSAHWQGGSAHLALRRTASPRTAPIADQRSARPGRPCGTGELPRAATAPAPWYPAPAAPRHRRRSFLEWYCRPGTLCTRSTDNPAMRDTLVTLDEAQVGRHLNRVDAHRQGEDRKSTRLNSSHVAS